VSPQGTRHAYSIQRLGRLLVQALGDRAQVRVQLPFAASDLSEPEPDVAVVPSADYLDDHPKQALLLVEVAESSVQDDRDDSARAAENLDRVDRFCAAFESLPFDDAAASRCGEIRAQLRREGRPIGANDLLIAAIALAADLTLVTRNLSEFRRVPGLTVDGW
jgi:tRNA(fMet)-specific endonuclease VapC